MASEEATLDAVEADEQGGGWKEARTISALIGEVPSLFTSTIHFLNLDTKNNEGQLSQDSKFNLKRLCKSPSFYSSLYVAHRFYLGESHEEPESIQQILSDFGTEVLSVMVSLLYLHNRIRKGCSPDTWEEVRREFLIDYELCGLISQSLPACNLAFGLRVAVVRAMGSAMLFGVHKEEFIAYKRRLRRLKLRADCEYEEMLWNCNHAQIGSLLLNLTGQTREHLSSIVAGLTNTDLEKHSDDETAYATVAILDWLNSLLLQGEAPSRVHRGEYYPLEKDQKRMLELSKTMMTGSPLSFWPNPSDTNAAPKLPFR